MKKSERIKILEDEIIELKKQINWQKEQINWLMHEHSDKFIKPYPEVVPSYPVWNPVWADQSTAQPYPISPYKIICEG
ncbi:MAG: hypothetical protein PHO03_06300 [Candidatus Omnitrophica bacterium]|nr:hypothetical protein [Candidatus Omnitrophota bacterium]